MLSSQCLALSTATACRPILKCFNELKVLLRQATIVRNVISGFAAMNGFDDDQSDDVLGIYESCHESRDYCGKRRKKIASDTVGVMWSRINTTLGK